jgi:hypothetical protein
MPECQDSATDYDSAGYNDPTARIAIARADRRSRRRPIRPAAGRRILQAAIARGDHRTAEWARRELARDGH